MTTTAATSMISKNNTTMVSLVLHGRRGGIGARRGSA
jgi:hypothetical protein